MGLGTLVTVLSLMYNIGSYFEESACKVNANINQTIELKNE